RPRGRGRLPASRHGSPARTAEYLGPAAPAPPGRPPTPGLHLRRGCATPGAKGRPVPRKQPLSIRLYSQPALYELARAVGYAGRPAGDLRAACDGLRSRFGEDKVAL